MKGNGVGEIIDLNSVIRREEKAKAIQDRQDNFDYK